MPRVKQTKKKGGPLLGKIKKPVVAAQQRPPRALFRHPCPSEECAGAGERVFELHADEHYTCRTCSTRYSWGYFSAHIITAPYHAAYAAHRQKVHRAKLRKLRDFMLREQLMDEFSYLEHVFDRAGL